MGDIVIPPRVLDRLWANYSPRARRPFWVVAPTGCWEWQLALSRDGYGTVQWRAHDGRPATTKAHRAIYRLFVGPIPDGLELDHLCRNRMCVNPAHLEPVTRKENVRRGKGHGSETHCPKGHPYIEGNIYTARVSRARRCRECTLASNRAWKARNRAKACA